MLWKSENVLFDGDTYFESLFAEWARATRTIELETYIFDDDKIGDEVVQELRKAASRGVRVRVLVDGIGSSGWWQTRGVELQKSDVEVRVYHPLLMTQLWRRLMIDLKLIRPERKPKRSLVLRRLNRRNHRKVSVIDGQIAFVGSINVSDCHVRRISGPIAWRDTCVRLEGPGTNELQNAFEHAWQRSELVASPRKLKIRFSFRRRTIPTTTPVSLNYTRRFRKQARMRFMQNLEKANERIWISNAYLAPSSNIIRGLSRAASRGVDVRILVPAKADVWFMSFIARAYHRALLKAGVRIFEYQPRVLHAKSLIVDREVLIGSSNLNRRSLLHDLEVDVRLDNAESLKKMNDQYLIDLSESVEVFDRGTIVGSRIGTVLNYLFRYWV
jgi:cardiolipin synthase